MPLLWSAISEISGRKVIRSRSSSLELLMYSPQKVYLVSLSVGLVGAIVAGTAHSIGVLIGMRCLQAAGSVREPSSVCSVP